MGQGRRAGLTRVAKRRLTSWCYHQNKRAKLSTGRNAGPSADIWTYQLTLGEGARRSAGEGGNAAFCDDALEQVFSEGHDRLVPDFVEVLLACWERVRKESQRARLSMGFRRKKRKYRCIRRYRQLPDLPTLRVYCCPFPSTVHLRRALPRGFTTTSSMDLVAAAARRSKSAYRVLSRARSHHGIVATHCP